MKRNPQLRLLSLILTAVMALGLLPAASAAPVGLRWKKSDVEVSPDLTDRLVQSELHTPDTRKPTDMVRVSIILEEKPTLMAGYATAGIGTNAAPDAQSTIKEADLPATLCARGTYRGAGSTVDAGLLIKQDLLPCALGFGIVAPLTPQRTALEIDRGAKSRAVVHTKPLNFRDR